MKTLLLLTLVVGYILSPVDLLPERTLGPMPGFADDFAVLFAWLGYLCARPKTPALQPPRRPPLMVLAGEAIHAEEAAKGIFLFGQPGSGKSHLIARLMEQLLGRCVVVAVTNKRGDYYEYHELARRLGVPVFRMGKEEAGKIAPIRLDLGWWFTDGMRGGSPRVLAFELSKAAEMVNPSKASGGEKFWTEASNDLLTACVNLCRLSLGHCDLIVVLEIARSLPTSDEHFSSDEFLQSACGRALTKAAADVTPQTQPLFREAQRFVRSMGTMGGKARTGIVQGAVSTLQALVAEFGDRITGGNEYDISRERRRPHLLIIDGQPLVAQQAGQAFNFLHLSALHAEAKERRPDDVPFMTVAIIDECPLNIHAQHSAQVQNVLRSQGWGSIHAAQTLDLMVANLGGDKKAEHEAKALVTAHGRMVFMSNTNAATNAFASETCGTGTRFLPSGGGERPQGPLCDVLGVPGIGFTSQIHPRVEVHEFARLQVGEAVIVTRDGYRFASFYEGKER